jgi:hypothetical protein
VSVANCSALPGALLGGAAMTFSATGAYQFFTVPAQTTLLLVHM